MCALPKQAAQFSRSDTFVSARRTTADTGIAALLPAADIDEYVFEPCGYSMNGLQGGAFSTIHVTPEAACSYASVELTGCAQEDVAAFVARVSRTNAPFCFLCPWSCLCTSPLPVQSLTSPSSASALADSLQVEGCGFLSDFAAAASYCSFRIHF